MTEMNAAESGPKQNVFEYEVSPEGKNMVVYITHPDETMRKVVHRVMTNQITGSLDSEARQPVQPFWQVGYEPDSEEIMLEFWKGSEEEHRAFIDYLQTAYKNAQS